MTTSINYPFSTEDLNEFQENINKQLDRHRVQLQGLIAQREDWLKTSEGQTSYGEESKMDQEIMKLNGLIENDQQQILDLENALLRVENKSYGICTETGAFIRKERLLAAPTATTCI